MVATSSQRIQIGQTYSIWLQKNLTLWKVITPIANQVRERGKEADRSIIFCRTYSDCSSIFELITLELASCGALITSTDAGQVVRLCEKFTASLSPNTRKKVIASFTNHNGTVRIVVVTVAFGLGLDSPNVRHVIHWGPPEDLKIIRSGKRLWRLWWKIINCHSFLWKERHCSH